MRAGWAAKAAEDFIGINDEGRPGAFCFMTGEEQDISHNAIFRINGVFAGRRCVQGVAGPSYALSQALESMSAAEQAKLLGERQAQFCGR